MVLSTKPSKRSRVLQKLKSVKQAFEKFDSERKLEQFQVRDFSPNVSLNFERGHYIVKTAENGRELEECLRLRFDVFHKEFINSSRMIGVDVDALDYICDHLLIYDKRSQKVIGTYRLNSSLYTDNFYSANEFNLGSLLEIEGNKLELGRACIDREHRSGVVIALLWRGIAEYIQRTDTKILFGCGSIKVTETMEIGVLTKHFADAGVLTHEYGVCPTKKYSIKHLDRALEYIENNPNEFKTDKIDQQIPPLFQAYLRMGGKLLGFPAIDREFNCVDFLTMVKMDEMSSSMKEKYKL